MMGRVEAFRRDGDLPLRVHVEEELLHYKTSPDRDHPRFEAVGRWTVVRVVKAKGGKVVAAVQRLTSWQGEKGSHHAKAFPSLEEAYGWIRGLVPERVAAEIAQELGLSGEGGLGVGYSPPPSQG